MQSKERQAVFPAFAAQNKNIKHIGINAMEQQAVEGELLLCLLICGSSILAKEALIFV